MHKLEYKNGLLHASVKLKQGDKEITIEHVIIDTGASHTIILTDYLSDLDVGFSDSDELVKSSGYSGIVFSAVRKKIDKIEIEGIPLVNMKIDFGVIDPYERVNGLIGLDFLMAAKVVIDLADLLIIKK